jgi:Rrf2 family protein
MRLSEGVEWTAHCAVLMAALPPGVSLSAKRLAEFHGVPGPYLAKSLQALMRAGIVESSPGRHGGYRLARPAADITLLEVVLAVEGNEPFFRCTDIRRRGPAGGPAKAYSSTCGVAAAMWRAEEAWRSELEKTTIGSLMELVFAQVPAESLDRGAKWLTSVVITRR